MENSTSNWQEHIDDLLHDTGSEQCVLVVEPEPMQVGNLPLQQDLRNYLRNMYEISSHF